MHVALREVGKVYERWGSRTVAVDRVSFEAGGGEVVGVLGPSGSGKTTSLSMLLGLVEPTSGVVAIDGDGRPEGYGFLQRIGYVPEEPSLYPHHAAVDQLAFFGSLRGLGLMEGRRRAHAWLERMGLADVGRKTPGELSKGMAQRVQLGIGVLHDPQLLVLDEPFSGLDPLSLQVVRDVILERRAAGTTVLLASHRMAEVETLCDRVVMLHRGRRVLYGGVDELLAAQRRWVSLDADVDLSGVAAVASVRALPRAQVVTLAPDHDADGLLAELARLGRPVRRFEVRTTLEDLFVAAASEGT